MRSAARKSGRLSDESALTTPTRVTRWKSWPFANICVPTRISRGAVRQTLRVFLVLRAWCGRCRGPAARCVRGKFLVQPLFQVLRAFAKKIDKLRLALRALLRHLLNGPAVVAFEPIAMLVIGHRNAAVLALHRSAATSAQHRPGISATIDQHKRLRFVRQAFGNSSMQRPADRAGLVRLCKILSKINNFYSRHRAVRHA